MSVNDSVSRIVAGSGIALTGTFIGMLLDILFKRMLTSYLSSADFGTYFLALTVISIIGAVATLGLNDGVPRYIAFFRGSHEEKKIIELIISAITMGLIAGLLGSAGLASTVWTFGRKRILYTMQNLVCGQDVNYCHSFFSAFKFDISDLQGI
jgi:O-antigen/teichoic acid export membrane protein